MSELERLEPSREELLLTILRLIDADRLPQSGRFVAAESRTFGGDALILVERGPGDRQENVAGFVLADLRALARAELLEVDGSGNSVDVLVRRVAREYAATYSKAAPPIAPIQPESASRPSSSTPRARDSVHDAFICHAHADKVAVARPLAKALTSLGFDVWYDEWSLEVGDSLRAQIDEGLRTSRYGIVIISPSLFERDWPQKELDGLAARESSGVKVILPVWHEIDLEGVAARSPLLAGRMAARTSKGISAVAAELARVLGGKATPLALAPAPAPVRNYTNAPMLRWLDPTARLVDLAPVVDVWCENSGPATSTAVVLRRWAEMNRPDESAVWEPLDFEQFNVPSYIHSIHGGDPKRRFLVRILAARHARELGPVLVRWSVLYKDSALENGYITTASLVAHLDGPGQARLTDLALDVTNARTRNERYVKWVREHGEPST